MYLDNRAPQLPHVFFLVFVSVLTFSSPVRAVLSEDITTPFKVEFTTPEEVVKIFLAAVDRNELVIFKQVVQRSQLIPTRVEYVYEIGEPFPSIKIYAELKAPLPVPEQDNCEIRAISASLDEYGHIVESKAHIWFQ